MDWQTLNDIVLWLDKAVIGRLCVQAWLGHANVLFLGFGEQVIPPPLPGQFHAIPEYELVTGLADWYVDEDGFRTCSTDERDRLEAVLRRLVGRRGIRTSLFDWRVGLDIGFEGGLTLRVVPYCDNENSDEEAWSLWTAEFVGEVRWDGTFEVSKRES